MTQCVCSIVPPEMLKSIARHGNAVQRKSANRSLVMCDTLRRRRTVVPAILSTALSAAGGGSARLVYSSDGGTTTPGRLVRGEGAPPSQDRAVNEAYDGATRTLALYKCFVRDSLDGNGVDLVSTVHYGRAYDNAFWDGSQMVYGDGDGYVFNGFTSCVDVVGHELSHGMIQHTAGLEYSGETGALNESMADCFGTMVKHATFGQKPEQADWLIGAGLLSPSIKGSALRSMKSPGTAYDDPVLGRDPQPAHMSQYVNMQEDSGGVHVNSGIANRAFYLAAMALPEYYSWERVGWIWYTALSQRLNARSGLRDAALATIKVAAGLFGAREESAVRTAWAAVGLA